MGKFFIGLALGFILGGNFGFILLGLMMANSKHEMIHDVRFDDEDEEINEITEHVRWDDEE